MPLVLLYAISVYLSALIYRKQLQQDAAFDAGDTDRRWPWNRRIGTSSNTKRLGSPQAH
ncbi:hypothetical protein IDH44_10010 [Paenibacillus sp. IB182496]|uniref:Uncharacterized protein n=1 Tax=Paenibacillus sabuli TaxID=2772509 RepID=A0A927GRI3_9BACL|nr:hypothetical protein [Paenibacillus sabuli]MBD2845523.1 hypothetical protein [Paenibacillus sabuli]